MKYAVLVIALICYLSPLKTSYSEDKFSVDFDYAVFKDENPSKLYVELYYSFNQRQLTFVKTSNGYEAGGKLTLQIIKQSNQEAVIEKTFKVPFAVKDTAGYDRNKRLMGQINMLLDHGLYTLVVSGSDYYDTSYVLKHSEDLLLDKFDTDKLDMSSIELASEIVKSKDKDNIFYKNTLEVTPNPSLLFGSNMNSMFYYYEIYNMNKDELGESYVIDYSILDSKGVEDYRDTKTYKVLTSTKVEFGSIDLTNFTTDKYSLIVRVRSGIGNLMDSVSKAFYVYNPKVKDNELNQTSDNAFLISEFAKYSDNQVNNDYEKMIYIVSDPQKEQYGKLGTLDAKRLFLYNFWKTRNADPSKARKEYFTRVDYANKNYRNDFFPGWRSDMGRVYILYGPYSDIERHEFESQTRAYQIWFYNNIQGGAQFVFIDQSSGVGNFVLIHSTAQNEIRNENWQDELNIRK